VTRFDPRGGIAASPAAALRSLIGLAAIVVLLAAGPAVAQECPCDCYFSSDCEPGNFCNWGSLPVEDSCFWRTPKPQGSPGANCDDEYNDWGQCDGICTPTTALSAYSGEKVPRLIAGIRIWADAMTTTAMSGGGHPNAHLLARGRAIQYLDDRMFDGMWRVAVEALTLARGQDFMIYPTGTEVFHSEQARVKDLSGDPDLVRLGNLAVQALIAEIEVAGAGQDLVEQIRREGLDGRLDQSMFGRVCRDEDTTLDCLYTRLRDMAEALGRGGRDDDVAYGTGPTCNEDPLGCAGDVDGDEDIDVDDLVQIILRYGFEVPEGHPADPDQDGVVDVDDIVMVLSNWGPC
jgi:hypothetical protein